jgi:hypothetical protein
MCVAAAGVGCMRPCLVRSCSWPTVRRRRPAPRPQAKGKELVPLLADGNLVDAAWGAAQPPLPLAPMRVHPLEWAGQGVAAKLGEMRTKMKGGGLGGMDGGAGGEREGVRWGTLNAPGGSGGQSCVHSSSSPRPWLTARAALRAPPPPPRSRRGGRAAGDGPRRGGVAAQPPRQRRRLQPGCALFGAGSSGLRQRPRRARGARPRRSAGPSIAFGAPPLARLAHLGPCCPLLSNPLPPHPSRRQCLLRT